MEDLIVTGGLGFIGSNFIHHIIQSRRDLRITNVDCKGLGSNPANVRELRGNERYRFVKGDLADYTFVRRILKDTDIVVNLAAQTHVDRSIANPGPFFESNARGAFNLFRAAQEERVDKVVHISTDEVYGSIKSGSFDEESSLKPSSPYSATKASADLIAHAWYTTYKLPIIILRCTNNFGPRQHPEKFIPKAIIRALTGRDIPLYGGGRQVRDWIYVEDFCAAIELTISKGNPGDVYNISAGNEMSNREVAEKLVKQLDGAEVRLLVAEDRPGHDFRYSLDSKKARRSLGWKPAHSFDEGLAMTVKWYREHVSWWKPIATGKVLSDAPWKEQW
ncbi:dTDP-glucose 4,6-dehydratase [archaeon 13_2_20CM_2_52_21]|nr:MAG: dTDP-glucose 4,6-dehydratase [archaeon 13_2_20CM_2_52_21]